MNMIALLLAFFRFGGLDFASMAAGNIGGLLGMLNAHELPDANFNVPGAGIEADQRFMEALRSLTDNAQRNAGMTDPAILQAYQNLQGIDSSGLINAGQQAGGQYGDLAALSQRYSGMLGNQFEGGIAQQNAMRQAGTQALQQGGRVFDEGGQVLNVGRDMYGAGREMYGAGREMYGAGGQVFDAGKQVFQTAQDPQNQLRNFLRQQTVDDSRAATSARGIGMGGNAAGIENDANRRFEMEWQNNQLARQLAGFQGLQGGFQGLQGGFQGLQGGFEGMRGGFQDLEGGFKDYAGGYQTGVLGGLQGMTNANTSANQTGALAGANLAGSMNLASQVPGYTMQSAQAPIASQAAAYSLPMDYASMFSQAQGQNMGQQAGVMSSIYPYLGMAQQGQQAQFGANMGRDVKSNEWQQQSQYGIAGGGQSSTPFMGGSQSGVGNPANWIGMFTGGMGGFGG